MLYVVALSFVFRSTITAGESLPACPDSAEGVASIPGLKEVKRISAMSKYIDADRQGGVGRMLITLLLLAEELFS
jgi:hypothetical protein